VSNASRKYSRRDLIRDLGWSLAYTGLIILLLKTGFVQPINLARLLPER
jgi:hypothetical protein